MIAVDAGCVAADVKPAPPTWAALGLRRCLLKRPQYLTDKQQMSLRGLLGYDLKSVRAYLLKEEFLLFWEYV